MSTRQKAIIGVVFLLSQLICTSVFCELPDSQQSLVSKQAILRIGTTSTSPVIDGDLNDKCWQDASRASGFITNDGMWPTEQTTAYVTYDDTCIYLAFRCNDSAPEKSKTETKMNDNLDIFQDDTVEIFLDTNHDRTTYYHFAVNSLGARYEAHVDAGKELRDAGWNPAWEVKTKIGAQYWTAEMRIPFASLSTSYPQSGTCWGINLTCSRWAGKFPEYTSWAMITGGFNQPMKFGELIFGDYPDVSYSVISIKNFATDNELRIRFRNGKESLLTVHAQWTVGASSKVATVRLRPREEKEICFVSSMSSGPGLALTVANAKTGEIYDFRKAGWEQSPPLIEMSLDRYYYALDVQQVQVNFTRKIKNGDSLKVEVGKNPDEKPVVSRQIFLVPGKDDYNVSFDITDWSVGRYVVSAHLQDKSGKTLSSVSRVFIKKKMESAKIPSPAPKVSLRSDGIILLDEKPFCPFFVGQLPSQEKKSPLVKDCFNVEYADFGLVSRPLKRTFIGLPGWSRDEQEQAIMLLPGEEKMLEGLRNVITAQKTDPLLLCWFMAYEAAVPMYRGEKNKVRLNNVDELRKINRFVKSIDPSHPTVIEVDSDNWADYKDSADIVEVARWTSSYASYLIPNLIKDVDDVRKVLLGQGKPFFFWIGSSIPTADRRTAEEIRCASYLALMHGAAGIVFHMGHEGISPSMTRHWSVYTGLSREVEELFPILTSHRFSRISRDRVVIDIAGMDYCVREYNDRFYLVVVNTSGSLVKARISIADYSGISQCFGVLFENREIKLTGNSFVDVFTAFEPHVYEFVLVKGE